MKLQDYIIEVTTPAIEEFFRYAKKVPEDKLSWKPLDIGRSVIDLAREIGMTPDWAYDTITQEDQKWDEDAFVTQKAEMDSWLTIEECEKQCLKRLERFYEAVRQLPDEKLSDTKWLPYEGGRDFTFAEMLDYPRWNANYHLGQIAYIQILYGDKEMY